MRSLSLYPWILVPALFAAAACGDEPAEREPVLLLDTVSTTAPRSPRELLPDAGWEIDPTFVEDDNADFGPFAACASALPRVEEGLVEFDTGLCAGYTVRVALADAVAEGEFVEFIVAHTILASEVPAEGRMVFRVDDEEVWQWVKSIPEPADATTARFVATRDIPAGTFLGLHVSNHGANNWRLVSVRAWAP